MLNVVPITKDRTLDEESLKELQKISDEIKNNPGTVRSLFVILDSEDKDGWAIQLASAGLSHREAIGLLAQVQAVIMRMINE